MQEKLSLQMVMRIKQILKNDEMKTIFKTEFT